MLDWIILLIVGAFIGWIASLITRRNESQGTITDIIVGIVGALVARWIFGGYLGIDSANAAGQLSVVGIFWGVVGSVVLVLLVQVITRLIGGGTHNRGI